jgi:alpha-beta hydrolase superfamily lysophospholipase
MPFDTQRQLDSPSGARLNLYSTIPANPVAAIQINHGLAEHAARYARFANVLHTHGFATYAHDHRGHGATKADNAPLGSFGATHAADKVLADVGAVHDLIGTELPGVPVILFGHSMGALIGMNFVLKQSPRLAGAAIWNGNFSAGLLGRAAQALLAWERFRLGSDVPSRLLPKLTFADWSRKTTDGRTAFDWLSRDPGEVDAYVADPLCGWNASVGMWTTVFDLIFSGADDRNFSAIRRDLPLNIAGGAQDPATDGGKATAHLARRLHAMGFSNLVSTVYPDTRHESLNELNRDIIMQDFIVWARGVVAGDAETS